MKSEVVALDNVGAVCPCVTDAKSVDAISRVKRSGGTAEKGRLTMTL